MSHLRTERVASWFPREPNAATVRKALARTEPAGSGALAVTALSTAGRFPVRRKRPNRPAVDNALGGASWCPRFGVRSKGAVRHGKNNARIMRALSSGWSEWNQRFFCFRLARPAPTSANPIKPRVAGSGTATPCKATPSSTTLPLFAPLLLLPTSRSW